MADKDWNPDDLLNFHYDHEVPGRTEENDFQIFDDLINDRKSKLNRGLDGAFDSNDELKRYEELRQQSSSSGAFDAPGSSDFSYNSTDAREAEIRRSVKRRASSDGGRGFAHAAAQDSGFAHSTAQDSGSAHAAAQGRGKNSDPGDDQIFREFDQMNTGSGRGLVKEVPKETYGAGEIDAIKQASREAYDRYRSNYTRNKKKRAGKPKLSVFHKVLTVIYALSLGAFVLSMTVMDVLPFGMMIALYTVLALLSLLIFVQIRRKNIKKWGKGLATVLAVLLIFFYGVGTAYAMGTLSFLSSTSVENEKAVANITKDPFNVVITGMDVRGKIDEEGRSDVNMVVTVNPETSQILMTSIPRDYEIYMPDKDNAMDKLTHTGFYGIQTTILSEEQLLDMTANYYVKVNFTTVEKFIDAIGGVDVYSEYEFTPVKMKDWTVQEGMNHMNGEQALAFARERKAFPTGDRQRIINQQAVFEAMFKKATSSRTMLLNYSKILSNLKDYFEMSFSSRELRKLVKMQIAKDPDWQMYKNTIVGGDGTLDTYSAGYAYVMTQDEESIRNGRALIKAVMNGQPLEKDEDGVVHLVETESEEGTETEEE